MRRRHRVLLALAAMLGATGALAWRHQSTLIGYAFEWRLGRHDLPQRRAVVAGYHRLLLMPPPADALVPELFELTHLVSRRVASGEISFAWVAHLYTTYHLDLVTQRPTGTPRRTSDEIQREIDRYVQFYSIRKRPDARGVTVADLLGTVDDVITLEEIEEAERTGREIDLRTRGLH
jgi:hypothetical protein